MSCKERTNRTGRPRRKSTSRSVVGWNGLAGLRCADDRKNEDNCAFPVSVGRNSENQVAFNAPPPVTMTIILFAKTSLVVLMTTHLR